MRGFLKEFREFAMRGNIVDMAVGIVIGLAFGAIIKSLVADVIMPPVGMAIGGIDFSNLFWVISQGTPHGPYATIVAAQAAHAVTINYGTFVNTIITFIIIAFAVFMLVRSLNKMQTRFKKPEAPAEATTKSCPHCFTDISIKATRCPNCTSNLG